jgi:hypothetical protein
MIAASALVSLSHAFLGEFWQSLIWMIAVFVWFLSWRSELKLTEAHNASQDAYQASKRVFDTIHEDYKRLKELEAKWNQK